MKKANQPAFGNGGHRLESPQLSSATNLVVQKPT